jgi:hypothetical protein
MTSDNDTEIRVLAATGVCGSGFSEASLRADQTSPAIAAITRHQALHLPIPEWSGLITGMACPYNPSYLERGAVYRFCVNHVVEPDDPYEMFPIEYMHVR